MSVRQWPLLQPGDWDQPFLVALGLSVLLHALLLSLHWTRPQATDSSGISALNAVLMRPPAPAPAAQAVPEKRRNREKPAGSTPLAAEKSPTSLRHRAEDAENVTAGQRNTSEQSGSVDGSSQYRSDKAPAGIEAHNALKPGEVRAVVMIREDGHVGQILWRRLPALTHDQLFRIEVAIRARKLPGAQAGQVRSEIINIKALLAELEGDKVEEDRQSLPEH